MNKPATEPVFYSHPEHQPFRLGSGPKGALLIHGFPGTPAEMRPLGERLAQSNFTSYGILLPGFGPDINNLPATGSKQWLAAAGEAWDEVKINHDPAFLIGFSMGAAVAIHLATANPPDALVLLAPFWRMGNWQFQLLPLLKHFVPSFAPFNNANFDDPVVREQLAAIAPGADLSDPATQAFFREEVRLPLDVLDHVRRLGLSASRLAGKLSCPVLILQGREDITVRPEDTKKLARRMNVPVTLREVPGNHSFTHASSNESYAMAGEVVEFLQTVA